MADQIPGRRMTGGESFYTDWMPRGGDSMLLRVEALKIVSSAEVQIIVETRKEPGGTITTPVAPTTPSTVLSLTTATLATGYYKENLQAEVRLKIVVTTSSSTYAVLRVFPPIFFDAAK